MRISVYTNCWNEALLLPHFLRWYSFADRIYLYDDLSDDGSIELARACPNVELRKVERQPGDYTEQAHQRIKNGAWRGDPHGEGDWAIVCDVDEFLWHPQGVRAALERLAAGGVTLPKVTGYHVVADRFPWDRIDLGGIQGVRDGMFDKRVVFRPAVVAPNYHNGCHQCCPSGRIEECPATEGFTLLHMRFLGMEQTVWRTQQRARRRDPRDQCHTYTWSPEKLREEYEQMRANARPLNL